TVDRELNLNGLKIHRSADGRAIYQLIDQGIDGYNTLKVPKGGRFKVLLPDSTVVWLNSESELRYPCNFLASARKVSLSGEAYFEVFKNRRNSFTVSTSWAEVKVLGTGFNVRAYQDDQEMETFVSHGTVMVSTDQDEKILHKNDRIHVNREGQIKSL
ncbi:FecR domain-containing protein, partial [Weissella cibaria]|nr:FecR domain-containing protein [Weissella cibaria]